MAEAINYIVGSADHLFLVDEIFSEGIKITFGSFKKIKQQEKAGRFENRQKGGA